MKWIQIDRISELNEALFIHLIEESLSQGFRFVERLVRDYRNGANCFDKLGEALFAAAVPTGIIGIGGLNRDPYFNDPHIGRLRHLYIKSAWRGQGVGRLLVEQIAHTASQRYQLLTLRTDTSAGDKFYQKLGFKTHPNWEHTTHYLQLTDTDYYPLD